MLTNTTAIIAELCVYLLTWNVGGKRPDAVNMNDMLSLNAPTSCPGGRLPDLYVLGFQEVNINLRQYVARQDHPWTLKMQKDLSMLNYVNVGKKQMQGLLINVWSQSKHVRDIKAIETSETATGIANVLGNKGAVSVRMHLYGVPTAFVVAHLAAHDGKVRDRVADYRLIAKKHGYATQKYDNIFKHDVVFWSGDLNFRLSGEDTARVITRKISNNQLDELFAKDELQMVKATGQAFSMLHEEKPTFPPTFKFKEGTSEYNLKRRPAWCDRILYRVRKMYPGMDMELKQLSYKSHPQYVESDHKPVTAEFLLTVGVDRYI